jgi:hypothetical protein
VLGSIQGRSGNHCDWVQKKMAEFANHMNESVWETLAWRSKIACMCTLFKAYAGEWAQGQVTRTKVPEQGRS